MLKVDNVLNLMFFHSHAPRICHHNPPLVHCCLNSAQ